MGQTARRSNRQRDGQVEEANRPLDFRRPGDGRSRWTQRDEQTAGVHDDRPNQLVHEGTPVGRTFLSGGVEEKRENEEKEEEEGWMDGWMATQW